MKISTWVSANPNQPTKKMERLKCVTKKKEIKILQGLNIKTFKKESDKWLKTISDEPKISNFAMCVVA